MCSLSTSQGLVLATAMAVSAGTILLFDHFKYSKIPMIDQNRKQALKSCLSSGSEKKKKNKKVQFADDVKDSKGDGESYRRARRKLTEVIQRQSSGIEVLGFQKLPPNHAALYSGILRDRVRRMEHFN